MQKPDFLELILEELCSKNSGFRHVPNGLIEQRLLKLPSGVIVHLRIEPKLERGRVRMERPFKPRHHGEQLVALERQKRDRIFFRQIRFDFKI